ncbi:hypothetical protein HI914_06137 [Erysiphe necator]|uniref:Putative peptidyl-trna hydrolase domain-containing protein n=1 Tax=Uncinula necator TaxID=52586 RepID=A0A0B1PBS1_UNCNE|nr:hypothetical protein HI914_06137 [Erysiphe necator]KHJ34114.1 putative peptidyl-trna hydrolase domain-containing protein [Erysiphe necator]
MALRHLANLKLIMIDFSGKISSFSPASISVRKTQSLKPTMNYSTKFDSNNSKFDFDDARKWFSNFNSDSLPDKIAKTTFSRASGPGGQKTNKTSSKATTSWPVESLLKYIPRVLHADLEKSRYFVASSQSILIKCDTHRSQASNKAETHERLFKELIEIYHKRIPGITTLQQKKKVEKLYPTYLTKVLFLI